MKITNYENSRAKVRSQVIIVTLTFHSVSVNLQPETYKLNCCRRYLAAGS